MPDIQETVIANYCRYFRSFARSGVIKLQEGPVSWIHPRKGEKGPSIVFRIRLNPDGAECQIRELIPEIQAGRVPALWYVTPDSTPSNIRELLAQNGFRDLSQDGEPEPTMALMRENFSPRKEREIFCRRVCGPEEFREWVRIVNTALHGWEMIDPVNYYPWVGSEDIRIYLGILEDTPVSACATIQGGRTGSLEFVATLEEYRRRGAAAVLCSHAIEELFEAGAELVTLGACGESVPLYKGLGFRECYPNVLMRYEPAGI